VWFFAQMHFHNRTRLLEKTTPFLQVFFIISTLFFFFGILLKTHSTALGVIVQTRTKSLYNNQSKNKKSKNQKF
jgi:hypothetical protein